MWIICSSHVKYIFIQHVKKNAAHLTSYVKKQVSGDFKRLLNVFLPRGCNKQVKMCICVKKPITFENPQWACVISLFQHFHQAYYTMSVIFIYKTRCQLTSISVRSVPVWNAQRESTLTWHDATRRATSPSQYLPVSSSPAGWGNACWLICSRAPPPGSAWCRWLGWPGWSRCTGRGRRRRLPPTPAQGGGAAVAAGPIERGRGKGREGRSALRCAWQLGHDPAL